MLRRGKRRRGIHPNVFVGLLLLSAMVVVALAMTLVEPPGGALEDPPDVVFEKDEQRDQIVVVAAEPGLTWQEFQVQMSTAGRFALAGEENLTRGEPFLFADVGDDSPVQVGDRVQFCLDEGDLPMELDMRHRGSRQIMDTWSFTTIIGCEQLEQ